jgi:GR25 family glycosyltransferase involved in LPS biosynthesis
MGSSLGVVFLIVILIILVVLLVFFLMKKRKQQSKSPIRHYPYGHSHDTSQDSLFAGTSLDSRKTLLKEAPPKYKNLEAIVYTYGQVDQTSFLKQILPHSTFLPYAGNELVVTKNDIVAFPNLDLTQDKIDGVANSFKIIVDGEPNDLSRIKNVNLIITTKKTLLPTGIPNIYVPFYSQGFTEQFTHTPLDLLKSRVTLLSDPPKELKIATSSCKISKQMAPAVTSSTTGVPSELHSVTKSVAEVIKGHPYPKALQGDPIGKKVASFSGSNVKASDEKVLDEKISIVKISSSASATTKRHRPLISQVKSVPRVQKSSRYISKWKSYVNPSIPIPKIEPPPPFRPPILASVPLEPKKIEDDPVKAIIGTIKSFTAPKIKRFVDSVKLITSPPPTPSFRPVEISKSVIKYPTPSKKASQRKFCAYMYSHTNLQYEGIRYREDFFDKLQKSARGRVDALGKSKNPNYKPNGNWNTSPDVYGNYKFVISIENSFIPGYITEKLTTAFLAGAIPIYMGAPDVAEHFNPKSFIHLRDYPSIEEAITFILKVDRDPELYQSFLEQPILNSTTLPSSLSWFTGGSFYTQFHSHLPLNFRLQKKSSSLGIIPHSISQKSSGIPIKVINLEVSKDRWAKVSATLEKGSFERFDAIYGKSVYPSYAGKMNSWYDKFTPGELGIYLSNYTLWAQLLSEPVLDYYVILEDDIIPFPNFNSNLSECIKNAPADWDMIFIGLNKDGCKKVIEKMKTSRDKYFRLGSDSMPGAFGYIVRKKAAATLSRFAFDMNFPVDVYFQFMSRNLNIYAASPSLLTTDYISPSTIRSTDPSRVEIFAQSRTAAAKRMKRPNVKTTRKIK